ncbi:MAG TPA: ATP-binding protein [Longimicrobiales bacterium]
MKQLPTLRRELVTRLVTLFAGALYIAVVGIVALIPSMPAERVSVYVAALLLVAVLAFTGLALALLRKRLFAPLENMVAGVEQISGGETGAGLPAAGTEELARLSAAVTQMADRLLADQKALAANIRSLDETNRQLTEARDAMVHTEKMASVGRLSSGIAHEIGNPLGAIIGYLGLLARDENAKHHEFVEAAQREARRIDRIVRGLLDFARPRDALLQDVDLNEVLRETIELVHTQGRFNGVTVHLEPSPEAAVVAADPYQLQQVMVNLMVNATDAMEGTADRHLYIGCGTRRAAPAPVEGPARRKEDPPGINYTHRRRLASLKRSTANDPETVSGRVAEFFVRDTGPGIPSELIEQVFEPFVTTKDPGRGTGLGLAVCARLVESMGGVIRARNAEPSGAEFLVILPALAAEETQ